MSAFILLSYATLRCYVYFVLLHVDHLCIHVFLFFWQCKKYPRMKEKQMGEGARGKQKSALVHTDSIHARSKKNRKSLNGISDAMIPMTMATTTMNTHHTDMVWSHSFIQL